MTRRSFLAAAFGTVSARALPAELRKGDRLVIAATNILNPPLSFHPHAFALIFPPVAIEVIASKVDREMRQFMEERCATDTGYMSEFVS